ncbi:hypothetical protein GCM10023084_16360 [Streptomyces lacrimifluminis]|uniref:Uncharacterized protein n=1 Tax=Streptomyces lacrimifluminis TaxID=1500077 RepID=A0A917KC99_9ACTN|nr:hypothetical protein [Streptomyces lacrimifluminis]GGJ07925.1 hypothetical protein GCM10012282_00730 [Streptomyces lacrimifluminis]
MPAIALLAAVFISGIQQFVSWQYGTSGVVGLLLLTIGIKARNATLSSIGAVVLALLVTGPAL